MMYKRNFAHYLARLSKTTLLFCGLAIISTALTGSRAPSLLEQIQQQGQLEFLSSYDPSKLSEDAEGLAGLEYDLMIRFAQYLGVKAVVNYAGDSDALVYELQRKPRAVAAGIIRSSRRAEKVMFGPSYLMAETLVISHVSKPTPTRLQDIIGQRILVKSGSAQAEYLHEQQKTFPALTWQEEALDMQDLQEKVHSGKVDIALLDRACFEQNKALYTNAQEAFSPSLIEQIGWAFAPQKDRGLIDAGEHFFAQLRNTGALIELRETYFSPSIQPDQGITQFNRYVEERLPRWEDALKQAASQSVIDWTALAAVGYQESKWDAKAVSETGVRGLMMLTPAAAKDVDISNPFDAKQSIAGGARYLRLLLDRLPDDVHQADRLAFALVAYNIGYQHLEDARQLALNTNKDPNSWEGLKQVLPLLDKGRVYQHLRYGYARGRGAVIYVENIKIFSTLLVMREQEENRIFLASNAKTSVIAAPDVSPQIADALQKLALVNSL